jgi:hypothetical protein
MRPGFSSMQRILIFAYFAQAFSDSPLEKGTIFAATGTR